MSFYTALTGLNGSQADIAATSNNIANVGTTGFKRSRAEFGDIFATSPLQNSSSSIGSGSILKGVKQQFTQGNIAASLNALDLAISGQGFFALKPSLTSSQVVYTRNGSFNVDNNRNVVDSTGQFLLTYPVNEDGSVTSKTINDAVPLQLPVTSGDPKATSNIDLSINLPADAPVITDHPKFADGYQFSTSDPESFTNSTSLTIFDDLGNPTIATVYFIKTQAATAEDPTNKYATRLVIDETIINPDLVASVNDNGEQIYIDRFGNETTVANIPDDNYFSEGKGAALYRKDDLDQTIPSQPAKLTGSQSSFDFGEEGNKLIEITNDPMKFNATREAGNSDSSIFWGKDFLLVNVDDGDVPVSIDLRPGFYNATQLASEVQRAINDAYGDDNKLQVRSNVDDTLTIDFYSLNTADGTLSGLSSPVSVDLLQSSYVTEQVGIDVTGSSPDFTREEFLAHSQARIIDTMNGYVITDGKTLGVEGNLFTRSSGAQMSSVYGETDIITFDYKTLSAAEAGTTTTASRHLAYSYYDKVPTLNVYDEKLAVASSGTISYDAPNNVLTIQLSAFSDGDYTVGEVVRLAGYFDNQNSVINGREMTILEVDHTNNLIKINTTGEGFPDATFTLTDSDSTSGDTFKEAYILSSKSTDVEAFFEGENLRPNGAVNSYNNKKIVLRETADSAHSYKHNDDDFGSIAATSLSAAEYYITSVGTTDFSTGNTANNVANTAGTVFTYENSNGALTGTGRVKPTLAENAISAGTRYKVVSGTFTDAAGTAHAVGTEFLAVNAVHTGRSGAAKLIVVDESFSGLTSASLGGGTSSLSGLGLDTGNFANATVWVDEKNPPIKISYDAVNQRFQFGVNHTAIGPGTDSNFRAFKIYGAAGADGTNNLGIQASDSSPQTEISSTAVISADSFVADGSEMQINAKRFGAKVGYNSDTKSFTFSSGSTGEDISADGALGVSVDQNASNIQVGRYAINTADGSVINATFDTATRYMGTGDNGLMGVGQSKNDTVFDAARGLASEPARAVGAPATEPLNEIFSLSSAGGANVFNVSVNGISGIIEVPSGNYVGSTLAADLQTRINQISD
ncbi:MAG: flagellar hook-basal body complex protein, partial [Kordiimonadaceae bacterium]|nr:flagellar hook-basal body complex protein [Kordiimonadaceae bacterium]